MKLMDEIKEFGKWQSLKNQQSTAKSYFNYLRSFCVYLGNPDIKDISMPDVLRYLAMMRVYDYENNTIMLHANAIRKFFEYEVSQKHSTITWELIPIPTKSYRIPRVATEEGYRQLLSVIPIKTNDPRHIRNLVLVNLLWDTGARIGELLALNAEDVDTEGRIATIRTEKNRGSRPYRQIFWNEETNAHMSRWLETRKHLAREDEPALFISCCHQKVGIRFTKSGAGEALRRYSNKAKIPYMNAHSFRHRMGRSIIEKGGSVADVANILGHASFMSSQVYTMLSGKQLKDTWVKFNQKG